MALPSTWAEVFERLTALFGGDPEDARRDAEEWLRDAVEARWKTRTLHDLDRGTRQIALQKSIGLLLALEEAGLPDELVDPDGIYPRILLYRDGSIEPANGYPGRRGAIAETVARFFDGVAVEGPPWRIYPLEQERPTYESYVAAADFG